MGQDLSYRRGGETYEWRVSRVDWGALQALRARLPTEVTTLFEVPQLGDEVSVSVDAIRAAAATLREFLAHHADLLPCTYEYRLERSPFPFPFAPKWGSGGMSGIRLPGDTEHFYAINAGFNECYLEKWAADQDGKGVVVERRDLREVTELQTEEFGTITIRGKRAKTELSRVLREILGFLDRTAGDMVVKTVA